MTPTPGIDRIPITAEYDWLRERLRYINASEMATVLGVEGAYGSRAALYAEKKGLRPPMVDSGVLKRGRWGEASVAQAMHDTFPSWDISRAKVHVIDRQKRLACTPDAFAVADDRPGIGTIQMKVVARAIFRERWLDDPADDLQFGAATVPAHFIVQTVTERYLNRDRSPWCALACLIVSEWDWNFRLFDIEPNPELEQKIEYRAAEFWEQYLDPGIMPPFEPLQDESLIRTLYPKDDGSEVDLSGDNLALATVEDLVETTAALKRLRDKETELKTILTGKLGPHTYGRLADGRRLSWRLQHRKAYTAQATDFRVLRILKRESA